MSREGEKKKQHCGGGGGWSKLHCSCECMDRNDSHCLLRGWGLHVLSLFSRKFLFENIYRNHFLLLTGFSGTNFLKDNLAQGRFRVSHGARCLVSDLLPDKIFCIACTRNVFCLRRACLQGSRRLGVFCPVVFLSHELLKPFETGCDAAQYKKKEVSECLLFETRAMFFMRVWVEISVQCCKAQCDLLETTRSASLKDGSFYFSGICTQRARKWKRCWMWLEPAIEFTCTQQTRSYGAWWWVFDTQTEIACLCMCISKTGHMDPGPGSGQLGCPTPTWHVRSCFHKYWFLDHETDENYYKLMGTFSMLYKIYIQISFLITKEKEVRVSSIWK